MAFIYSAAPSSNTFFPKHCSSFMPLMFQSVVWESTVSASTAAASCSFNDDLTPSLHVSWVSGWRRARCLSASRANARRSCRLMLLLRGRMPWRLPTHSWWTWVPPPQTRLHPGHCGDGEARHLGRLHHRVAPFLPVAREVSCWRLPHLARGKKEVSNSDYNHNIC